MYQTLSNQLRNLLAWRVAVFLRNYQTVLRYYHHAVRIFEQLCQSFVRGARELFSQCGESRCKAEEQEEAAQKSL
jgi:hypothetical protein